MSAIVHLHARQVLDSRGNPTVEVEVGLESGAFGLQPFLRARRRVSTKRSSSATEETLGLVRA